MLTVHELDDGVRVGLAAVNVYMRPMNPSVRRTAHAAVSCGHPALLVGSENQRPKVSWYVAWPAKKLRPRCSPVGCAIQPLVLEDGVPGHPADEQPSLLGRT